MMITKRMSFISILAIVCVAAVSCVDDRYDLSDVDTTVRVDVNQLTLSVNLDEITLGTILEEDNTVRIVDGRYAIVKDGTFSTPEIYVEPVYMAPTAIPRPDTYFLKYTPGQATDEILYDYTTPEAPFFLKSFPMPVQVTSVDAITGEIRLRVNTTIAGYNRVAEYAELRDLEVQLPKGLHITDAAGGTYDPETGIANVPKVSFKDMYAPLNFVADAVDLRALGVEFDEKGRSIAARCSMCVKSGKIALVGMKGLQSEFEMMMVTSYDVEMIEAKTFTGRLRYNFHYSEFSPVRFNNLPDFLSRPGTNIILSDPSVFLRLSNPLQLYNLKAETGFTITSYHSSDESETYSIDAPYFTIGADREDGIYTFCISPAEPDFVPEGYENPEFVNFSTLGEVMGNHGNEDNGLPSYLFPRFTNLNVPDQPVVDLPLGVHYSGVRGDFQLYAPLAFAPGTRIVYGTTLTGWGTDECDYITITQLDIDAEVMSDFPLGVDIEAYPVDSDGNAIGDVKIEGAHIDAGTAPQPVHIRITGQITGFDGIRYTASAYYDGNDEVLRPDMNLKVRNLRPTISGYYLKEL